MYVIFDHKVEIINLLLLKTLFTYSFFANFAAKDLESHIVLPHKNKLHLIKDEIDFLFVFQRTISLNLDFLNDLSCFINFSILFHHLDHHCGTLGIFTLCIHLAFTCFPERLKSSEFFFTTGQFIKKCLLNKSYHICNGSLCLSTPLDKLNHELPHSCVIFLIKCLLELYTRLTKNQPHFASYFEYFLKSK